VDLAGLLAGKKEADIVLSPMDEVIVFDRTSPRSEMLKPLVEKLKQQTASGGLMQLVEVDGNVRLPGVYPLAEGMVLRDLVLLSGGLKEASYLVHAEVTRSDLSNLNEANVEHIKVNLAEQLMGKGDFRLQAKDKLSIFGTPEYREEQLVELRGEVRFPGKYLFRRGETLSQVVSRAGGLTSMAHVEAAVFTRESLKRQEVQRLKELQERMRKDIASSQLEDSNAGKGEVDLEEGEELLEALSETKALGRLVIDLDGILSSKIADIQLKPNDSLVVPSMRQEISVLGEVQHPTSHLYHDSWTLDDYLEKSGGMTSRADDDRLYVVRADGSVYLPNQSGWLTHGRDRLKPGDAIIIPVDTDRIKSLDLWSRVSTIVYQIALGYRVFRLD
jgi:protein involved in polysaccharide export with SLBB domain